MPLRSGVRLGPFELLSSLGSGSMGEVYRARDIRLDRIVAVKVLHARVASQPALIDRFEREARIVAALNHPHICTLFDVGVQDGVPYLVMEYLEGQTFANRVQYGPVPPDEVMALACQIARALAAAHAKGIVHRDLKPANLFVTTDGRVKILDFGIAKVLAPPAPADAATVAAPAAQTREGWFLGTVEYAAPEQLRGHAVEARTDLFSLGAVLHELLTGHRPFERSSEAETIAAILAEHPPGLPPIVPPALASAVSRCLEKHPGARFQSALELLAALEAPDSSATSSRPSIPSIAVLPFADLSPDHDQEYFCDGMADELIAALMSLESVRVASRTSSFQFKAQAQDVIEIGRRLKVDAVLEGSVRTAVSRLRVVVQMTDARTGFQLWSERFDRSLEDVFAVQDEIARAVVDKLRVRLRGKTDVPLVIRATTSTDAYFHYLKGRYALFKFTQRELLTALDHFGRAVEIEPNFAAAHAMLGHAHILLTLLGYTFPRKVMPQAKAAVLRSLALNPDLAEAQSSLALVLQWYEWDWGLAEQAFRRAIELSPGDPNLRRDYSTFLVTRGRGDEAVAEAERAIALDPFSPMMQPVLAIALYASERHEEALRQANRAIDIEPMLFTSYWMAGLASAALGSFDEAIAAFERGRPYAAGDPSLEGFLGWAYAMAGNGDAARAVAGELDARRSASYVSGASLGLIYQGLGDMDRAVEWYRRAFDERAGDCATFARLPHFAAARLDPRFRALVARIESGEKADA